MDIAAGFADAGLHGASTETIARRAGITQAYVTSLLLQQEGAGTTAALVGVAAMVVTAMASLALARQRAPVAESPPAAAQSRGGSNR